MRDCHYLKGLLTTTLGLSILSPLAAAAVSVVNYSATDTFNLNFTTGNANQDFGTVHIQSDSSTGWILQIRSAQGSSLHHDTYPFTIPYTLTVDGIQVSNLAGGNDVTVRTTSTLTCPPPEGCSLPVRANLQANDIAGKPSGNYSDALVFTLINNPN